MSKFITMLTRNDVTAPNAMELFLGAKDAPCDCWGFKDTGISEDEMKRLADTMKANGKMVFMESLAFSEKDTLKSLRIAKSCGVDFLMGGTYYKSAADFAKCNRIRFSPFLGLRHNGRLYGDIDELADYAAERAKHDVFGLNISAYRYECDCDALIKKIVAAFNKPVIVSGSINSYERIRSVKSAGCWAFTIGSAFFSNTFGEGFSEQIKAVSEFLNTEKLESSPRNGDYGFYHS